MSTPGMLTLLRKREGWADAVVKLKGLADEKGDEARAAARTYANVYKGRRGAMVFDVVASRQRKYATRVRPSVAQWEGAVSAPTLSVLASTRLDPKDYGLREDEPATMQTVAANLLDFADESGLSDDEACRRWAEGVDGLQHAHALDPVVGSVSGIGPALFAYMRMRCGANALKPDVRVAKSLNGLGFTTPGDSHSVLTIAQGAAAEIDVDLLTLDQLLWEWKG
ncbi:hypothetical protein [Brachybacterium sp. 107]|uniref:hypothetical protein n=1 Tax=Brachybacterium sp. 107 TaxID=3457736 RepID=UPI004034F3D4